MELIEKSRGSHMGRVMLGAEHDEGAIHTMSYHTLPTDKIEFGSFEMFD